MEDQSSIVQQQRQFWLKEIWDERRETFKALVADTLLFSFVLAVLSASHFFLEKLHYPPQRKELIERIHFYGYLIILVIFITGVIIKILAYEYKGIRGKHEE